jgi:hypothetical protein
LLPVELLLLLLFFARALPLATPAWRAISRRRAGVKLLLRFLAPRLPSATAAAFFFFISVELSAKFVLLSMVFL